MILTAHARTEEHDDVVARARALFDMALGRVAVHGPLMRSINPDIKLMDYLQPMTESGWTETIRALGDGSLVEGIKRRLDLISADGVYIDTPFETDDLWGMVELVDQIRDAIAPRIVMPNFGDADTWMGRISAAKALASITDWHLVEVFYDVNKHGLTHWARRSAAVSEALSDGKKLVLGVYDHGRKNPRMVASIVQGWPGKVYWMHKVSLTECAPIPMVVG